MIFPTSLEIKTQNPLQAHRVVLDSLLTSPFLTHNTTGTLICCSLKLRDFSYTVVFIFSLFFSCLSCTQSSGLGLNVTSKKRKPPIQREALYYTYLQHPLITLNNTNVLLIEYLLKYLVLH